MGGQKELKEKVLDKDLCVNCGACVNLCPYLESYKDNIIILDQCDIEKGRCYAFCPRTPTNLEALHHHLSTVDELTPELGSVKGFYMTRASDPEVRLSAQHGGTVTTLITLALQEGIIDTAILSEDPGSLLPRGIAVKDPSEAEVMKWGKSKFVVSPTLAKFNEIAKGDAERIGIVGTPCQALALAKMCLEPSSTKNNNTDKLQLVVGLFCGWALSWRGLKDLLEKKIGGNFIEWIDIPPSSYHSMEVHTKNGTIQIPLDEVLPHARKACNYCFDMTAEFSDISVGSARLPEGWEEARGWNQVIARTEIGQNLLKLARAHGVLEFRDVPEGNLEKLKKASMNKKRFALRNLANKSGSREDLLYLDCQDPVVHSLLNRTSM